MPIDIYNKSIEELYGKKFYPVYVIDDFGFNPLNKSQLGLVEPGDKLYIPPTIRAELEGELKDQPFISVIKLINKDDTMPVNNKVKLNSVMRPIFGNLLETKSIGSVIHMLYHHVIRSIKMTDVIADARAIVADHSGDLINTFDKQDKREYSIDARFLSEYSGLKSLAHVRIEVINNKTGQVQPPVKEHIYSCCPKYETMYIVFGSGSTELTYQAFFHLDRRTMPSIELIRVLNTARDVIWLGQSGYPNFFELKNLYDSYFHASFVDMIARFYIQHTAAPIMSHIDLDPAALNYGEDTNSYGHQYLDSQLSMYDDPIEVVIKRNEPTLVEVDVSPITDTVSLNPPE